MSFPNQVIPTPIREEVESERDSSEDSSFEESLDSEVVKIKDMTSALTSDLTKKLKNYKSLHRAYMSQGEELSTQISTLKEQKKFLEPITNLKEKICEINEKLIKACNDCKAITEEEKNLNGGNLQELLNSFHGNEGKEKYELGKVCPNTSASQIHKEPFAKLETEGKNNVCSCLVI